MTTEEKIFNAARIVFQKKGFAGARMQEIADEAGINKAMLHYCFKNKQLLFEAVFMNAFSQLAPQINAIFNSNDTVIRPAHEPAGAARRARDCGHQNGSRPVWHLRSLPSKERRRPLRVCRPGARAGGGCRLSVCQGAV